jgi:hypothetical protein
VSERVVDELPALWCAVVTIDVKLREEMIGLMGYDLMKRWNDRVGHGNRHSSQISDLVRNQVSILALVKPHVG